LTSGDVKVILARTVHGRTLVVAAVVIGCLLPTAAQADPMPPGDYTVNVSAGSVKFGSLPPTPIPGLPPFEVTLADQPETVALPFPYTFNVSLLGSLTITTTLDTGQATIDPATGAISADVALHSTLEAIPGPFLNVSGTCTYGSVTEPIVMHLATTPDTVWKLPGRSFMVSDTTYALPPPVCDDATLQALVTNGAGDTSAGRNSAAMVGTAARPEDAPPAPPDLNGGSSSGGGGNSTPTNDASTNLAGDGGASTLHATTQKSIARSCIVPRLRGRTLAAAKRALKRAGCRLGNVSKRRAHRRRGTVLAQSKTPGRKLPRGTRVALTLARR
jgi:hypothetical protein